jgi:signal transduction histidine kinase
MQLEGTNGTVTLDVRDDGVGFDPAVASEKASRGHFGLIGIRERVAAAGGAMDVDSGPGRGTRLRVTLPREVSVS